MPQTWTTLWLPNSSDNIPSLIVATYVLAASLSALVAWRTRATSGRWFWWFVAAVLLLLAFNKQLDLQGGLTQVLREEARQEGWYQSRESWQSELILAGGLVALAVGAGLMWLAMRAGAGVRLTVAGLVLVGAYLALRAVSFHPVDQALRQTFLGVRLHNFAELGCIFVVMAGALRALLRRRSGSA